MSEKFETTDRGFKIYGKLTDSKDTEITVQESSAIGRPQAWIFARHPSPDYKNPSPHLTPENAMELIKILEAFIEDSHSDANWRNDPEYKQTFG